MSVQKEAKTEMEKVQNKLRIANEEVKRLGEKMEELSDELLQKDVLIDKQAVLNKDKHKEIDALKKQFEQEK